MCSCLSGGLSYLRLIALDLDCFVGPVSFGDCYLFIGLLWGRIRGVCYCLMWGWGEGGSKSCLRITASLAFSKFFLSRNPEKAFPANLVSDGLSSVTSSRGKQLYTQVSYKIQKSIRRERQFFGGRDGVSGKEDWNWKQHSICFFISTEREKGKPWGHKVFKVYLSPAVWEGSVERKMEEVEWRIRFTRLCISR